MRKSKNTYPGKGKKVIGIEPHETEKHSQIGKLVEAGKAKLSYYSMGSHYYVINNDFNFQ